MNTAKIASHLNVLESAITRCEEWAKVLFVVVKGLGARFVSKKIVKKVEVKKEQSYPAWERTLAFCTVLGGHVQEDLLKHYFQQGRDLTLLGYGHMQKKFLEEVK